MTKLIADFRNFVNPPSNAEHIAHTVTFVLTWEVCDYHLGRNTHTHTHTHTFSWFSSVTPGGILF